MLREPFGVMPDGTAVDRFTLRNRGGIELRVLALGGVIQSLTLPDRDGVPADVVLGFGSLEQYLAPNSYFGALIGRYANRIARGRFTLDGTAYSLPANHPPNHLHGGHRGFDERVWEVTTSGDGGRTLAFAYTSPDGEEGYPGTLRVGVTYSLGDDDTLTIDYGATSDAPTPVTLTQHSYLNLAGAGVRDILDHELLLRASRFTSVTDTLIPTGELRDVAGTPCDFTTSKRIGADLGADDTQLHHGGGYDHNWVLDPPAGGMLTLAARLRDPDSGRVAEIHTTEPGIQLYVGQGFDPPIAGKAGRRYGRHFGIALETQPFPDSPNQPHFPSAILPPGARYSARTVYRFGTDRAMV